MTSRVSRSGGIALLGRPNAGKSTLFNKLVGVPLAIATPVPQTTRESLLGVCDARWTGEQDQLVLTDLPGPMAKPDPKSLMNQYLKQQVSAAVRDPDLIWCLCGESLKNPEDLTRLKEFTQMWLTPGRRVFGVLTKADTLQHAIPENLGELCGFEKIFVISARTGQGLPDLIAASVAVMPEKKPEFAADVLTDKPTRFFAAELVRKQLFTQLFQEIPFGCAVSVDRFDESKTPIVIEARIVVEREAHKGIVLGRGGSKIKSIGMRARQEIERLLDQKQVYLQLKVVVQPEWTRDRGAMKALGYVLH